MVYSIINTRAVEVQRDVDLNHGNVAIVAAVGTYAAVNLLTPPRGLTVKTLRTVS